MSAERELLIWLKPCIAPGASGAFKSVADMAKKSQNGTAENHRATTKRMKEDLSDYEKAAGKTAKQIEREDLRRYRSQSAEIKKREREEQRIAKQAERDQIKRDRLAEQGAKRVTAERMRAAKEAERIAAKEERTKQQVERHETIAGRRREIAEERVGMARVRAMSATLHLGEKLAQVGRGVALLGLSGNKQQDARMLQALEAVQGGFDVIAGGAGLIRAGAHARHAWHKYRRISGVATGAARTGIGGLEAAEAVGSGAGVWQTTKAVGMGAGKFVMAHPIALALAAIATEVAIIHSHKVALEAYEAITKPVDWTAYYLFGHKTEGFQEEEKLAKAEKGLATRQQLEEEQKEKWASKRQVAYGLEEARSESARQSIEYRVRGSINPESLGEKYTFAGRGRMAAAIEERTVALENQQLAREEAGKANQALSAGTLGAGQEHGIARAEKILELRERNVEAIKKEQAATLEAERATVTAQEETARSLIEKLEQRRSALVGFAMKSPEERAKAMMVEQMWRTSGGNLPDEIAKMAISNAATPEERQQRENIYAKRFAPEYAASRGETVEQVMGQTTYTGRTGQVSKVDVTSTHKLEIDVRSDTREIILAFNQVMDRYKKQVETATKALIEQQDALRMAKIQQGNKNLGEPAKP